MMAGMTLLRNAEDWNSYKLKTERDNQSNTTQSDIGNINWGTGPAQYPCLVASTMAAPMRAISCYVYLGDAQTLAAASNLKIVPATPADRQDNHTTHDFEKHVAAMLMTIADELAAVGITNPKRFEDSFAKHLQIVDQYHEADKEAINTSESASGVMRKLYPNDNCDESA